MRAMRAIGLVLLSIAIMALLLTDADAQRRSSAQFTDQQTWGGTSTGTNTIAITIPNWSSNLQGVPLRFKAANTNSGAATLNVSGLGAIAIRKQTATGLQALAGGEIQQNQIYTVIYDDTFWQLINPSTTMPIVALTATYTVATTDCGKYFSLGGNTFYSFNIGDPGSFPAGCRIIINNADTARGKGLGITGLSTIRMWPGNTVTVTQNGTSWVTDPISPIVPFPIVDALTLHVNAVSGSDNPLNSDCLATGAGACATFQNAVNIVQQYWVPASGTIQADCESIYQEFVTVAGSGGYMAMQFVGNPANPSACAWIPNGLSGTILSFQDHVTGGVSGFIFGYSGGGSGTIVQARQYAIVDVGNNIFEANPGGIDLVSETNSSLNTIGTITLQSATGNTLGFAADGGTLFIGAPINVANGSTASFTQWFASGNLGEVQLNSTITRGTGGDGGGREVRLQQ
jgi:hypothetical protein